MENHQITTRTHLRPMAMIMITIVFAAGACGAKGSDTSDQGRAVPQPSLAFAEPQGQPGTTGPAASPERPGAVPTPGHGSPDPSEPTARATERRPRPSPAGRRPEEIGAAPIVPDSIALEECRERYVIAPGVADEVRERVPSQFTLRYNSEGKPLLYITSIRCERYTVGGDTRSTTAAAFGASIESPDGVMCAKRWPILSARPEPVGSCNNYLFFAAYDNPAVVDWARSGTPDAPVHLVDNLVFDESGLDPASLGIPLHFESGATPSGYEMDLVVRERPLELPLDAAFWFESAVGTVRVGFATDAIALGEADGQLKADPGSEMAVMLGTETPEAQFPFPLLAGNRWEHATLTKTVLPAGEE